MRTTAIVLVAAIAAAGCTGAPASAPPSTAAAPSPSPSPAPLAVGSFTSHGVAAQLDARGAGASVTGTMTVSDEGGRATVTLECSRSSGGLVIIGGLVTESTYTDYFPDGHRVAVILQRGTPVQAVWWVSHPSDTPVATCQALVDDVDVVEATAGVEPIEGTVQLAP